MHEPLGICPCLPLHLHLPHAHPIHCINPHSDFGDGDPFRLPPLVSCVLFLPRLLSALEVTPNELSPLPTRSWLTPSNAPQRSPSECLSDTDALPLPYQVPSDL